MTTAAFTTRGARIESVSLRGHAGLAQAGQDVLCAALTSAIRLTECAVNDVLGIGAAVRVQEKDASVSLKLPGSLGEPDEAVCQSLMAGLMVYLTELSEEYPQYLTVINTEV